MDAAVDLQAHLQFVEYLDYPDCGLHSLRKDPGKPPRLLLGKGASCSAEYVVPETPAGAHPLGAHCSLRELSPGTFAVRATLSQSEALAPHCRGGRTALGAVGAL
jgi:hypothetical protein